MPLQGSVAGALCALLLVAGQVPSAVAEEAGMQHRIQLGAYRDRGNAVAYWQRLRVAEPQLLQGATPCIAQDSSQLRISPLQRLQVAVQGGEAAARTLCERLKTRGVSCVTVAPTSGQICQQTAELEPVAAPEAPALAGAIKTPTPAVQPESAVGKPESEALARSRVTDAHSEAVARGVAMLPSKVQKESLVEFDIDDPPNTNIELAPNLYFGAKVTIESDYHDNLDLDRTQDDEQWRLDPEVKFAFSYTPRHDLWGFAEFALKKRFFIDDPNNRPPQETQLTLTQAYLVYDEWAPGWSLQLGRQSFEDEREWLYDEKLDGIRLFYRHQNFGAEFSVTQEDLFDRDLLNDEGNIDPITNWMALARFAQDSDEYLDAYLLVRDDRDDRQNREEDLIFLGLHAQGSLYKRTGYWLDAALVGGERREREIRGWGFDLGATHTFDHPWKPSLTLAGAFGSGDKNRGDDIDRDFRQTGLQDNTDKWGGVASFRYYGEALRPELSNLKILTVGAGIRPYSHTSVDLVYHSYWQHHADDDLRDSALDMDPDGDRRYLGQGLDLVFGRRFKNSTVNWVIGGFKPGDAFPSNADSAIFSELEFETRF